MVQLFGSNLLGSAPESVPNVLNNAQKQKMNVEMNGINMPMI